MRRSQADGVDDGGGHRAGQVIAARGLLDHHDQVPGPALQRREGGATTGWQPGGALDGLLDVLWVVLLAEPDYDLVGPAGQEKFAFGHIAEVPGAEKALCERPLGAGVDVPVGHARAPHPNLS